MMAVYSGFFDAMYDSDTQAYDRLYSSADVCEYFGHITGSGVCRFGNNDSLKVSYDSTTSRVTVAEGYAFIRGYWVKVDSDGYTFAILGGSWAICAYLDSTTRAVRINVQVQASSYTDAIQLAIINTSASTPVQDTRGDPAVCGYIDTIGELSDRARYAKNYIDTTAAQAFAQYQQSITNGVSALSAKVTEVQGIADSIEYPKVGEIRYCAQSPGTGWLACNGSFVQRSSYPALCDLLGFGSAIQTSFSTIKEGFMPGTYSHISNCVPYNNFLFWFDANTDRLYYIDTTKSTITLAYCAGGFYGTNSEPTPAADSPVCLSIVTYSGTAYVFVTGFVPGTWSKHVYLCAGSLTVSSSRAVTVTVIQTLRTLDANISGYTNASPYYYQVRPYVVAVGSSFYVISNMMSLSGYSIGNIGCYASGSLPPQSGQTLSYKAFDTPIITAVGSHISQRALIAFREINNNEAVYVNACVSLIDYQDNNALAASCASVVAGTYSRAGARGEPIITFQNHGRHVLPTVANGYIIYEMAITSEGLQVISLSLGSGEDPPVCVVFPKSGFSALNNAAVFEHSITVYNGYFVIFLGSCLLITNNPQDITTFNFVTFNGANIVEQGGIEKASGTIYYITGLAYVSGVLTEVAYKLDLTRLGTSFSSNGVYLPNTSVGGVQGYIKAVSE